MAKHLAHISVVLILFIGSSESFDFANEDSPPTIFTLQMMLDFAAEKRWTDVVLFDCIGNRDCSRPYARPLLECFFKQGMFLSMQSFTEKTKIADVLKVEAYRIGVIMLIDDMNLSFEFNLLSKIMLQQQNRKVLLGDYVSWLLVSTKWNSTQIFNAMQHWPTCVDSDVSIAMSFLSADVILNVLHQFGDRTCQNLRSYGQRYDYDRLRRSQSISPHESTFIQEYEKKQTVMVFYTVKIYKIRLDGNAELIKEDWNTWNPGGKFGLKDRSLRKPRNDLRQFNMNFGLQAIGPSDHETAHQEEENTMLEILEELISLFILCLNVSANVTNFMHHDPSKISKENEDLVHKIIAGDIDIGAALFDVDLDMTNTLLTFSFPIVRFTRSIFFKPPDAYSNIFLLPFSNRLLLTVLGTLAFIVAVMELINYVTVMIHWKEDRAHFGLGEATLWCISIMCMQGSPWTPRTRAGKAVLLASLIFALIINNSYSGYITSILSTQHTSIKNVSDFFNYDYTFGCSKTDDSYIMVKSELRNVYVKALENSQMKVPEKLGLEKTVNGSYAFFVSETVAKRILRSALLFQNCKISEYRTNSPGTLALPISEDTPYKRIINVSILRMWQHGILRKLNLLVKPPLLSCPGTLKFKQAHLADVYGAFIILLAGVVISSTLFFFERAWVSRQQLRGIQKRIVAAAHLHHHHHHDHHDHHHHHNQHHPHDFALRSRPHDVLQNARLPMQILGFHEHHLQHNLQSFQGNMYPRFRKGSIERQQLDGTTVQGLRSFQPGK